MKNAIVAALLLVAFVLGVFLERRNSVGEFQQTLQDLDHIDHRLAKLEKHSDDMFETHSSFFHHFAGRIQILEASQPAFVDESEVPYFEGGAKAMSIKYPRIIIDGEKLYFNADMGTYCHHDTIQRAVWLEVSTDPPDRRLMTPEKEYDGVLHEFVGGKWRVKGDKGNSN